MPDRNHLSIANSFIKHYFCSCSRVIETWNDIKAIVTKLISSDDVASLSDIDIISLRFTKCRWDTEVVWLLGSFAHEVWQNNFVTLNKNKFFGFLKFKFKKDQMGSRIKMQNFWSHLGI